MEPIEPILGTDDPDDIPGTPSADIIYGLGQTDTIRGFAGWDELFGGGGTDTIYGGAGNDSVDGGTGHDRLYGGLDNDELLGGNGNDKIWGDAGMDKLVGGAGTDTLKGGDGNDSLAGGVNAHFNLPDNSNGHDLLYGQAGNDNLTVSGVGDGSADAYGGTGNDKVSFETRAAGSHLFGGDGHDRLSVRELGGSGAALRVEMDAAGDGVIKFGGVTVATFDDFEDLSVTGQDGNDRVRARWGDDVIDVGAGVNSVTASSGDDRVSLELGKAGTYYGGTGQDNLMLLGVDGPKMNVDLAAGLDGFGSVISGFETYTVYGSTQGDTIKGAAGVDSLMGYLGNDVLSGRGAADTLRGSDGEDQLFGGSGKDTLEGEADADSLFGGSGDDEIWGGNGLDVLTGGDGADNFRFKSTDVGADLIKDFQTGADELHIDRLLIGNALPAGELPAARFSEHGPNAFMGQFILVDAGEYDSLRWDANGMLPEDGTLEIARLWGESGLQASDILIV